MPPKNQKRIPSGIKVRVRIFLDDEIAIGPGKADLMEGIETTGSIAAAGRLMGMSYKRAWILVNTMNRCFRQPVVVAAKGGKSGGGARLTPFGKKVLQSYRELEQAAEKSAGTGLRKFLRNAVVR